MLATGRTVWIPDVELDPGFARKGLGVRAAFAFPIHAGGELAAVLEFFTAAALPPDAVLLEVMAQIGRQLGRVVERIRALEQVAHQATHDVLTGLANRLLFSDRLEHVLARAERRGSVAALLFLDIDRFKDVSDTLGHNAGDQLLRDIADRLRTALRASDMIARFGDGTEFTLARFGGDEFVVLCDDSVEALVRWQHPERGLLLPRDFIPIAEESALISQLGAWILRAACEQASRWRASFGERAPRPISVNVSARQLAQAEAGRTSARSYARSWRWPARSRLDIVAEGVETAAQAAEALALGCNRGQGYCFARPAPAAAIEPLIRTGLEGPADSKTRPSDSIARIASACRKLCSRLHFGQCNETSSSSRPGHCPKSSVDANGSAVSGQSNLISVMVVLLRSGRYQAEAPRPRTRGTAVQDRGACAVHVGQWQRRPAS